MSNITIATIVVIRYIFNEFLKKLKKDSTFLDIDDKMR